MKFLMIGVTSVALLILVTTPTFAQASTQTQNISIPFSQSIGPVLGHPCGTGDNMLVSGNLHAVVHTTLDPNGGFHQKIEVNHQGVSGVSLLTGAKYRIIRASSMISQQTNGATVIVDVSNQRLQAQEPGQDFFLHRLLHMTFNANGELTSLKVVFKPSCTIVS